MYNEVSMLRYNLLIASILILGFCVIGYAQFSTPALYDADGYLHIRMAEFLRDFGPKYNFHWARYSVFNGRFADKDFLYHTLLIPFTFFKNIFFGAKVASFIFAGLLLTGFYFALRRYSNKSILPFFLISFFLSDGFIENICRPRPLTIVILITILSIHFIMDKSRWLVFITALFYSLIHVTSPLIIFYALIVEGVRFFDKKEFYFKTILYAFFGVLLGFIIHPNFPNNFIVFYLNSILVPLYTIKTGVLELGAEFFPINTREYLLSYPVVVIGIVIFTLLAMFKAVKARFETKAFLVLAMFFFVLSFICRRYLGHGYLIILIGLSYYFSDAFETGKKLNKFVLTGLSALLIVLGINTFNAVKYNAFVSTVINGHYERAGRWMEKNIPKGELIFHSNWSDSQYFIGLNPKNDYFVTLDPVYMYQWNPRLYLLYRDISFGRAKDPYLELKNTFKVKYGYAGKNFFSGLINQIRQDTRFTILAEDGFGVIFKLN